ncbi:MICOS complex subunit mic60-like [Papaver somniferum]|uniref:MICOS complex subunit mic60-like n=1 Tax=Papaver somniferum TaxID=3469 RepID=UPI000E7008F0|nr:MICOS complex subunit mic60-like [Papaver somniferum]
MLQRGMLESGRSIQRVYRQSKTTQLPYFLLSRKGFSSKPTTTTLQKPAGSPSPAASVGKTSPPPPTPPKEAPKTGTWLKIFFGSVAVGGAVAAYQGGHLGYPFVKEEKSSNELSNIDAKKDVGLKETRELEKQVETSTLGSDFVNVEKNDDGVALGVPDVQGESNVSVQEDKVIDKESVAPQEDPILGETTPTTSSEIPLSDDLSKREIGDFVASTAVSQETETNIVAQEAESIPTSPDNLTLEETTEAPVVNASESSNALLAEYSLQKDEGSPTTSSNEKVTDVSVPFSEAKELLLSTSDELKDAYISKDGKLVLDFLDALHAAERKQFELDAHVFSEEKRILKEKYEKELKDARARQLMYAEEAAMLEKELNKERVKFAANIKLLQEKAEEDLKRELERKENEAEAQLNKIQDLAKAKLAAAIANEKASQIEKMAEANLNINALCMAFLARSEESRQSHSVYKLALGTLALEDALSNGLPIQREVNVLRTYLDGIDKDSLLELVLSTLPEETLKHGTDTQFQLNQKFTTLKDTLRHYSLIPPGGGGILTHTIAHVASSLKVKEDDPSGDGIESVISRVERLLAEGKLAEAAESLEKGVSGSKAEEIVGDWVIQARNRAIAEQALSVLKSYATAISLT